MEEKIVLLNQQGYQTPKMQEAFMQASEAIGEKVPGALRVMTFNAGGLVQTIDDHDISDEDKTYYIIKLIESHKPDVLCIQESKISRELFEDEFFRHSLFMGGYTLYCKAATPDQWGFVNHGQLIYVKKEVDAQYIELGIMNNAFSVIFSAADDQNIRVVPTSTQSLNLRTFANDNVPHGEQALRVAKCAKMAIEGGMIKIIQQATRIAAHELAKWMFNATNFTKEQCQIVFGPGAAGRKIYKEILQSQLLQDKGEAPWIIGSSIQEFVERVLGDAISQPLHAPHVQYYWSVLDAIKMHGSIVAVEVIFCNVFDTAWDALAEYVRQDDVSAGEARIVVQQKTFKAISLKLPMLAQTISQFVYKDTLSATTIVLGVISQKDKMQKAVNAIHDAFNAGQSIAINGTRKQVKSTIKQFFSDFIRESEADIVRKLISGVVRNKEAMNQLSEAAFWYPNNYNCERARWFALAAALMQIVENDSQEFLGHKLDMEGRLMVLKFPKHKLVLVSAYVFYNNLKKELLYPDPAAQPNYVINERRIYDAKIADFLARVKQQNPDCDLVYAGDMNATVLHYNDIVPKELEEIPEYQQRRQQQEQNQARQQRDDEAKDQQEYADDECDDEDTEYEMRIKDQQDCDENYLANSTLTGCNPFLVQSLQALLTSNALSLCDPFQPSGTNPKLATIMNGRFPNDSRCSKIDHIFTPRNRATQNAAVIVTQELVNIIRDADQQSLKVYVENTSDHLPIVVDILPVQGTASPTPKQLLKETPSAPAAGRPCIKIYKK